MDKKLVDPIGRHRVHSVRIKPGVAVATINSFLRAGVRDRLPVAEDSRTVSRVSAGRGISYEFKEKVTQAWK